MDSQARVNSLTSIESVRTALVSFADQVGEALTELESQMRRMVEWLEHDRPRHWRAQVRASMDEVHQAQQALQRCLMHPVAGERPSCTEERAALKKAQARQAYCEEKVERVRRWRQAVEHELFEYQGRISQLARLVEVDVPQAVGVLARVLRHLEEYQAVRVADPQAAYNDRAVADELMPAGEAATGGDTREAAAGDGEDVAVPRSQPKFGQGGDSDSRQENSIG